MPRWPAGNPPDSRKKRGDMPDDRPEGRGSFAADIADDAIAAALRSVEARERGNQAEAGAEGAEAVVAAAPSAPVVELVVEPEAPPGDPLEEKLAALVAELAQKDLLLEESMRRGRETMARLQDTNERMLRLAADLENYRKRAQREKEEIQKFGIEGLLKDLLPVLDNFDRALDAAPSCSDVPSFAAGVEMTRKLFEDTLGRFGVKPFRSLGEPFDPRIHEAVQGIESREHPANVIVQEIVRGFFLHERLVRPSMVVVSRGPGPEAAPAPEAKGDGGDEA